MLDQISDWLSILRLILAAMAVVTVMMGFVRYGAAFLKQIFWIAVIVGIVMFGIIPNL